MSLDIVAGFGVALESACLVAEANGMAYRRIELPITNDHNFDLEPLAEYSPDEVRVFIALDHRALNYARQQLMAQARLKGYRSFNLIAPGVILEAGVSLKGNVYIGSGSSIGGGCILGTGCWLESGVMLSDDVRLGAGSTLGRCVQLGTSTLIGSGTTLGNGVSSYPKTNIGRHCEWLLPGVLPKFLPDRSFYDACMPEGARILNH